MSGWLFLTPPPKQTRSPQTECSFALLDPIASYTLLLSHSHFFQYFLSLSFSIILYPPYLLFSFSPLYAYFIASLYTSILCKKNDVVPPVHFARFGTSSVAAKHTKSLVSSLYAARYQLWIHVIKILIYVIMSLAKI